MWTQKMKTKKKFTKKAFFDGLQAQIPSRFQKCWLFSNSLILTWKILCLMSRIMNPDTFNDVMLPSNIAASEKKHIICIS